MVRVPSRAAAYFSAIGRMRALFVCRVKLIVRIAEKIIVHVREEGPGQLFTAGVHA
jgi:hypothetical protein